MSKMDFAAMDTKRRALYERMWGSDGFDFPVEKTGYRGSVSNNSYTFSGTSPEDPDVCSDGLIQLFGIQCPERFKEKFKQSCSGSGQELKRIATVHSSSLCALLFFYNVSEENPYEMEIAGKEYIFTYSCFEYQNTVIEGRNPSNMDVVLIGEEKETGKPVVLFLESKFSEYYERPGKELEIKAAYLADRYGAPLYNGDFWDKMGLCVQKREGAATFVLRSTGDSCYLEGLKQMISHYIGIRKLCDAPEVKKDAVADAVAGGAKVLLGTILFTEEIGQLPTGREGEKCFDSYRWRYRILADALNGQLEKDSRITVLQDILSYSDFRKKGFVREPEIQRFYFGLRKGEAK